MGERTDVAKADWNAHCADNRLVGDPVFDALSSRLDIALGLTVEPRTHEGVSDRYEKHYSS